MAHYEIIKKSILRNYSRILVLEDDSFLSKSFNLNFSRGIRLIDRLGWDMIYLGFKKTKSNYPAKKISKQVIKPFGLIRGAYGYALNKPIFRFIQKNYLYCGTEIDVFFEYVVLKKKRVYAFYPTIVGHRDKLVSTITNRDWQSR